MVDDRRRSDPNDDKPAWGEVGPRKNPQLRQRHDGAISNGQEGTYTDPRNQTWVDPLNDDPASMLDDPSTD